MLPLNPFSKSCVAIAISQLVLLPAHAATITVNSNTDNDVGCTLREAIVSANTSVNQGNGCGLGGDVGTDTIVFANNLASNIITLNDDLLVGIGKNIEIDASQVGGVTLDANNNGVASTLQVERASLTLNNMTITDGVDAGLGFKRAAIEIFASYERGNGNLNSRTTNLSLIDSNVSGNTSSGILVEVTGSFSAFDPQPQPSPFYDSSSEYGVLNLTLTDSSVSGNMSSTYGSSIAGIEVYNQRGLLNLVLNRTTVSGNISDGGNQDRNGGINVRTASGISNVTLLDSTVSGNSSPTAGGISIYSQTASTNSFVVGSTSILTLNNSTVSGNSSNIFGGIHLNEGRIDSRFYHNNVLDVMLTNNSSVSSNESGDCVIRRYNEMPTSVVSVLVDSTSIIEDGSCGTGEDETETTNFVIPLSNGNTVIFDL